MKSNTMESNETLLNLTFNISEDMLSVFKNSVDKLTKEQFDAYQGMDKMFEDINIDSENRALDIKFLLDQIIMLGTEIEGNLDKEYALEFNDLCNKINEMNEIVDYNQGDMVICDDLPYMVAEVDYDDLSIGLFYKEGENLTWVNPSNCKKRL